MSRALWQSGLSPLFKIELPDGLRVRFYPSSISAALWVSAEERSEDAEFLRMLLRRGDTYVDAGANIGHLAIVARHVVGPEGVVTAIEANPRIFRYVVNNLQLNGFSDVLALNVALGEKRGSVNISDRRDDDQNRIVEEGIGVPMRPLDEVIGAMPVTLLKLDVEGFELQVLRGARSMLARTRYVYCELSEANSARFGYQPGDAEQLLLDAGFLLARHQGNTWILGERRVYETLATEELRRTGYNLFAVRPEALGELKTRFAEHGQSVVKA